jgi:hypothetical protein
MSISFQGLLDRARDKNREKEKNFEPFTATLPVPLLKVSAQEREAIIDLSLRMYYQMSYFSFVITEKRRFPTEEEKKNVANFHYWEEFKKAKFSVEISGNKVTVSPIRDISINP